MADQYAEPSESRILLSLMKAVESVQGERDTIRSLPYVIYFTYLPYRLRRYHTKVP